MPSVPAVDRRVTVAHCIHGLDPGGAQRVVGTIVGQGDRGRYRHLVYAAEDGALRGELERAGALVRIVPRRLAKLDPLYARGMAHAMRADRPAVIHGHLFGDSLHGYLAARSLDSLPVLMTVHSEWKNLPLLQRVGYRWLIDRAARTVACSDSVRDSLVAALGPRASGIESIPNGIDLEVAAELTRDDLEPLRRRLRLGSDEVVIASIGRMEPSKGLRILLGAFARLARSVVPHPRLVFLGDGSERPALERLAQREEVGNRVLFAGFRSDVVDLLPALDVVAFSSVSEGLSMAMLEAMAAARCIVGTDVPGITQAVRPEREALIVRAGDAEGLGAALRRAVADPELRRRLGAAARRRCVELFGAGRMVGRYEALYAGLAGLPATPGGPSIDA